MAFMERQVEFGEWFVYEDKWGEGHCIEADCVDLVPEDDICEVVYQRLEGFGARLSAPGYLDCTEWTVFGTEAEAHQFLEDFYPEDEEDTE